MKSLLELSQGRRDTCGAMFKRQEQINKLFATLIALMYVFIIVTLFIEL